MAARHKPARPWRGPSPNAFALGRSATRGIAQRARPRNTSSERLRRSRLPSASAPMKWPRVLRGTVVTVSTIRRLVVRRPFSGVGSTEMRKTGTGGIGAAHAHRHRVAFGEGAVLNNQHQHPELDWPHALGPQPLAVLAQLAAGGCSAKLCRWCLDTPSSGWRSPCVCRCPAVERRRLGQSDARGWAPAGPVVVFRAATDLFHARQGIPAKAS